MTLVYEVPHEHGIVHHQRVAKMSKGVLLQHYRRSDGGNQRKESAPPTHNPKPAFAIEEMLIGGETLKVGTTLKHKAHKSLI